MCLYFHLCLVLNLYVRDLFSTCCLCSAEKQAYPFISLIHRLTCILSGLSTLRTLYELQSTVIHKKIVFPLFRIAEMLEGKGAGKKGRFQGKVSKIQKRTDVEKMLKEYFSNNQ